MKVRSLVLVLSLAASASGAFAEGAPPPSELVRLDQVLDHALTEKEQGRLKSDRYEVFLVEFRASLNQAWDLSQHTPVDTSVYARIQAKLGDASQALATLEPALKKDPRNTDLLLARGEVSYGNKNYAAALAEADAILQREPTNKRALALKHFSEGRTGASGIDSAPARLDAIESSSHLGDPGVVSAGQRAQARQNALHFVALAQSRQKLDDPREALRYAVLAEASDPSLADAPMQQGLAYMSLKEPGSAMARFARAEELWQAVGDKQAGFARTLKRRAGEMSIQPPESTARATQTPDPRRKSWPLEGAGVGFLITGLGSVFLKKDEEDRWRKPLVATLLIGTGVLGGAFVGSAAFIAVAGEGGALALAGGGTLSTAAAGEAALSAVGSVAGGAAGAKAVQRSEFNSAQPGGSPGGSKAPVPGPVPLPIPLRVDSEIDSDDCALKPGEDVLSRFIDRTRLSPGFLERHEGPNLGHTIREHVRKKPEYLRERLRSGEVLEHATTFLDQEIAERAIRLSVEKHMARITDWYSAARTDMLIVNYVGDHLNPIGNGLQWQNPDILLPKYDAVVRIKRAGKCQIFILTAYPE